jgi:hypothetical protein
MQVSCYKVCHCFNRKAVWLYNRRSYDYKLDLCFIYLCFFLPDGVDFAKFLTDCPNTKIYNRSEFMNCKDKFNRTYHIFLR